MENKDIMADINIDGVVTWLKNWFYDKTEITGFLNNKANQSDLQTTNSNLSTLSSTVDNKVDKVTGKGLSTEDFTTAFKDKLDGIESEANKTVVDSALSSTSENPLQNKAINTALNGKAPTSHASSASTYGLGTTSNYGHVKTINGLTQSSHTNGTALSAYQGKVLKDLIDTKTSFSGSYNDLTNKPSSFPPSSHTHSTDEIGINGETLNNMDSYLGQNPTQSDVNEAIDELLGQLSSIKAIEVVATKPTASASTMGKLYIINEDSKINVYYTEQTGTGSSASYNWHKMDTDILDELSIAWNDITNKPSTFTPSSHTHGNISNDGKLGFTSGNILITTTNGLITSVTNLPASKVSDASAYTHIGTSANATQSAINTAIDTALGGKGAVTDDVDWTYSSNGFTNGVKLVDKTTNADGRITLHLKS